jgi:hypothetical protein
MSLLIAVGAFVLIEAVFAVMIFWLAVRQRFPTAVYVPVDEAEAPRPNAYMEVRRGIAQGKGYRYLGVCRDGKPVFRKVRYESWVSPDRRVFAVVGEGPILGIPVRATWLTSKLRDGRVLNTLDNSIGRAADLSGMTTWTVITGVSFRELLARHLERIAAEVTPVEPYREADPLGEHIELLAQRSERMAKAGYARFLGESRAEWHYTARGALIRVASCYQRVLAQLVGR